MIAEISSLITASKTAYDIAKGISSLHVEVERNKSISELLKILLAVQSDALLMQEKHQILTRDKDKLTKKLMEFEKWDETASHYELKKIATGVFVYSFKKMKDSKEPAHWICTNCYKKRKASILQLEIARASGRYYLCPDCKTTIHVPSKGRQSSAKQRTQVSRGIGWVHNY